MAKVKLFFCIAAVVYLAGWIVTGTPLWVAPLDTPLFRLINSLFSIYFLCRVLVLVGTA